MEEKSQADMGPAGGESCPGRAPEARGDPGEWKSPPEDAHKCCGCRFPLLVALLQMLLGVSIAAVAFIMAGISPSLLARETPHWAGIMVCLVSLLGFVLYCVTYLPDEKTAMQFIAKLLYFLLCTLGLILSVLVVAFVGHHYGQVNAFSCLEAGEDCVCTLDAEDPIARTFRYADVSDCSSITSTLKLLFLLQMVLNLAQALVCLAAAFILWKHRYQVFFVGLQHWQRV